MKMHRVIIGSIYQCTSDFSSLHFFLRILFFTTSLLDERYMLGTYRGTVRHVPDIDHVIQRAIQANVRHIIITAGTIDESRKAIQQTRIWNEQYNHHQNNNSSGTIRFSCTVGVHPTRCLQVFCHPDIVTTTTTTLSSETIALEYASYEQQQIQEQYTNDRIQELYDLCLDGIQDHTVVAYGECGLDYDRLEFCPKPIQQYYLRQQLLEIALPLNLPLFLHNRNVQEDLYITLRNIQQQYRGIQTMKCTEIDENGNTATTTSSLFSSSKANVEDDTKDNVPSPFQKLQQWDGTYRGVVHSFDDTIELALLFIQELQLYTGINGCSLRTEQNVQTIQQLPITRILLETEYVFLFLYKRTIQMYKLLC
jgi:TatD DNase family protein